MSEERTAVVMRIPNDLLRDVDKLTSRTKRDLGATWSRNDQLLVLVRNGLERQKDIDIARGAAAGDTVFGPGGGNDARRALAERGRKLQEEAAAASERAAEKAMRGKR